MLIRRETVGEDMIAENSRVKVSDVIKTSSFLVDSKAQYIYL